MGLSYTSIDSTYRCTVSDYHVSYAPAKEEEAPSQVETLGGCKQSSNCHTLAETHDDARVLVFVQLLDNSVEDFILRVAKHRVFLRNADVGFFCQLSECLYPALTVVFCNDKKNKDISWGLLSKVGSLLYFYGNKLFITAFICSGSDLRQLNWAAFSIVNLCIRSFVKTKSSFSIR